jgi:hypothetical protein
MTDEPKPYPWFPTNDEELDLVWNNISPPDWYSMIQTTPTLIGDASTILLKYLDREKAELADIVAETEKEEELLMQESAGAATKIEERLYTAYKRVRSNAINGLAVVAIQRDACGGCFNKIPPQRQMDIRLRKKIIVCEYCGRILVDPEIADETTI